jgi:PAS domain S-box-containing protein
VVNEQLEPQYAWTLQEGELRAREGVYLDDIVSKGLFSWAADNKCIAVVEDTQEDDRWLESAGHNKSDSSWSVICAPLIIRSRPVGAITMSKPGANQFDQESIELLDAIANHVASTVESARLYQESQERTGELAALVTATTTISGSLDLPAVLNAVAEQMRQLVNVDACALFEWQPQEQRLSLHAVYPEVARTDSDSHSVVVAGDHTRQLEQAIAALTPQQVHGPSLESDSFLRSIVAGADLKTALLMPIVARDRLVALAVLMNTTQHRQFGEQELNLLQMLANQAAIAIENARLYQDAQRQLKVSALLNEASRVINSSLDTNHILQLLLAQMNELINSEAISIALVDKQANELVYEVAEGIGSQKILGLRLPSNRGVSGWVMEHGQPALVQDTAQDERFYRDADRRTGHNTRSMMCAPLQVKGEVLGTVQAINPRHGPFTEDDLQLLVNLANLASSALSNAQQFARTQAAEARYMSLFEDSVNPILLTNLSGTIVEANRRALEFLGYERTTLLGQPIHTIHPQAVQQKLPQLGTIGRDEVQKFESKIVNSAERTVPVEGYVKRTASGDSEVLQWIYRDISQQVELEEMREDLMAMLVHDLQSPLGNIISSLELLRYELPEDGDPVLDSIVEIASRSSRRLQTLIRSLLDITHLEAGRPITEAEFVGISPLIEDAREIVQPALERRNVQLKVEIAAVLPEVYVDPDMISRVFINLLDNASKYTPEAREITITVRPADTEQRVLVSISDQGQGIPRQYRDVIFEKFRRIQGKDAPKGMGLGLAFCRLAVEAHGGKIWVDDAPGGGARFNFTLPTVTKFETNEV